MPTAVRIAVHRGALKTAGNGGRHARNRLKRSTMKKSLSVVLEDQDILDLMRLLMDDDADGALAFLKQHFKGKARELLEGG